MRTVDQQDPAPIAVTLALTGLQADALRFVLGVVIDDLSNMESAEDRDALYAVAAMLGMNLDWPLRHLE